jgi:hypothetical protein
MGLRHWKQHFAADKDLIFSKRMKLGCCGVAEVNPGDPVTEEMKAYLGRNRLARWWESKRIELARFDGDEGRQLSQDESDERELARLERELEQDALKAEDDQENGTCLDGPLDAPCDDEPEEGSEDDESDEDEQEPSEGDLEDDSDEQSQDDEGESEPDESESPF